MAARYDARLHAADAEAEVRFAPALGRRVRIGYEADLGKPLRGARPDQAEVDDLDRELAREGVAVAAQMSLLEAPAQPGHGVPVERALRQRHGQLERLAQEPAVVLARPCDRVARAADQRRDALGQLPV